MKHLNKTTSTLSYLGSNNEFSLPGGHNYGIMLIDWAWVGRTGKYLALGRNVRTEHDFSGPLT